MSETAYWAHEQVINCERCGSDFRTSVIGRCSEGACETMSCPACGHEWSSFGPVGCGCDR